jgi:hypothetical protein
VNVAAPTAESRSGDRSQAAAAVNGEAVGQPGAKSPVAFVCRKGAFCDDFEEKSLGTGWTDRLEVSSGRLRLTQDSASLGKSALEMWTRDESSSAFLIHEKADVSGPWAGVLGFALRVDDVPGKSLGGPELTMKTKDGLVTIGVVLGPEGLVLEQRATEECLNDRCKNRSWVIAPAVDRHWYRVRIGVEANPRDVAPYGRLEVSVDDGELLTGDLTVPFFDGSIFLRAGITQGDARPARAELDDVSLLVR